MTNFGREAATWQLNPFATLSLGASLILSAVLSTSAPVRLYARVQPIALALRVDRSAQTWSTIAKKCLITGSC
jgi:hypothetical protein